MRGRRPSSRDDRRGESFVSGRVEHCSGAASVVRAGPPGRLPGRGAFRGMSIGGYRPRTPAEDARRAAPNRPTSAGTGVPFQMSTEIPFSVAINNS